MRSKTTKIIIIVFCIFLFSIMFSLVNIGNERIYNNISIQHISVSGKTQTEAEETINKIYRNKKINQIKLLHNDYETTLSFDQLNINYDINKAIEKAYGKGRTGNIITNNYSILTSYFIKKDISLNIEIDENAIESITYDIESKLPDVKTESTFYIEGENLIIKKGKKRSTDKRRRTEK